jgi:hypothetical protein
MLEMGHSLRPDRAPATSDLPRSTDIVRPIRLVRFGSKADQTLGANEVCSTSTADMSFARRMLWNFDVRFTLKSGHSWTERKYPLRADCVEKVLSGVGTNFRGAAGALSVWNVRERFDVSGFVQRPSHML